MEKDDIRMFIKRHMVATIYIAVVVTFLLFLQAYELFWR